MTTMPAKQWHAAATRVHPRTAYIYLCSDGRYSVDFYGGNNHRSRKYITARRYWVDRLLKLMAWAGKGTYTEK